MKFEAIRKLYPNAIIVDDGVGVYDKDNKLIEIDEELVNAEAKAMAKAVQYKFDRMKAYPSIPDQLDMIYHLGIDAWKAEIEKVKNQYPKP